MQIFHIYISCLGTWNRPFMLAVHYEELIDLHSAQRSFQTLSFLRPAWMGEEAGGRLVIRGFNMHQREAFAHALEEWGQEHVCQTPPNHPGGREDHEEALDQRHDHPGKAKVNIDDREKTSGLDLNDLILNLSCR